ncbi:RusA family crossover junction endodeoxyribonuclease [Roseiconus nitratireducens]|uniref:RusA family crossover junction endodeoxyribonuclease n=1 Tax=Roseiconus nitratireducens TaxID=2605748 RepID=A0A5M6D1X9_9BACT|nr:RusA family crossover junction endodeoxyribonuclease [Roseiconus nitratireducens]KAA5541494.1 RusA family crossover junction endodeoxyribonuclease [Roseiconus nitratireducens]
MFKLQLPFPPSVNTYWRHVGNRVLVSKKGRQYQATVSSLLDRKNTKTLDGELIVDIRLVPPDRRRRDVDNSLKALLDAMQFGGAYHDDAQIVRLTVEKHQPDPDDPRAEVVVQHVPAPIGEAGYRTCLRCDEAFESDGPGNRICVSCRQINSMFGDLVESERGKKRHNGEIITEREEDLV